MALKQMLVVMCLTVPMLAWAENSIVGQWVMPVPNNAQCSEYYRFDADGQFAVSSDQERVTGRYDVEVTPSLPKMNVVFLSDNNMTDCFGNTVDQTGQKDTHFLKWDTENTLQLCSDVTGQNCPVKLYRQ